jgi:DNA-binding CsgD family transcriptional regulator
MKRVARPAGSWPLGPREKQLLRRFAQGKPDAQIAQEIGGTERQIAAQRQALISKLRIRSAGQLATTAAELAPWPKRGQNGGP